MTVFPSRTLSVSIERDPKEVLAYVIDAGRFPEWARGFALGVRETATGWVVDTEQGPVGITFVDDNPFGVADHTVAVSPGVTVRNPIRVLANGDGAEVLFTLFQTPGVDDEAFAHDCGLVAADLRTLKQVLESR